MKKYWQPAAFILVVVAVCFVAERGRFDYKLSGLVSAAVTANNITNYSPLPTSTPTVGYLQLNWAAGPYARVLPQGLGGSPTPVNMATPLGAVDGSKYTLEFDQPATGETINLPASTFITESGAAMAAPATVASGVEVWNLVYNGTLAEYVVTSTSATLNASIIGPGAVHNSCNAPIALSAGVASTALPACFSGYSKVDCEPVGPGTPVAAVPTPTTLAVSSVNCAQPSALATSINCTSSSASDGRTLLCKGLQ